MQSSQIRVSLTLSFDQFPELEYLLGLHGRGQRQFEILRLIEMGLRYQAHLEGRGFKRAEEDSKTAKEHSTLEQAQTQNRLKSATFKKTTAFTSPAEATTSPAEATKAKETKEVVKAKSAPSKKTVATPAIGERVKTQEGQGEKAQSYQDIPDDVFYDPTSDVYEAEKAEPKNDGSQAESSLLGNFLS